MDSTTKIPNSLRASLLPQTVQFEPNPNVAYRKGNVKVDTITMESMIKRVGNFISKDNNVEIKKNFIKKGLGSSARLIGRVADPNNFSYIGNFTGGDLLRTGIGLYVYSTQDIYFGHWVNNRKHDFGIYLYKTPEDELEYYAGFWYKGVKHGFGLYVWKNQMQGLDRGVYDVFIGNFQNGVMAKGLYLSRKLEGDKINSYYYFGKYDSDGVQCDDNAFYYTSYNETLVMGEIDNENLIKGSIIQGKDGRVFNFEKSYEKTATSQGGENYAPEEVLEDEAIKEVRDVYDNFIDFDKNQNVKLISGLIVSIRDMIKKHSSLATFTTNELNIETEVKFQSFVDMFNKFDILIAKLEEKKAKLQLKKKESINIRASFESSDSTVLKKKPSTMMKSSAASSADSGNMTPSKKNSTIKANSIAEEKPFLKRNESKIFKPTEIPEDPEFEFQSKRKESFKNNDPKISNTPRGSEKPLESPSVQKSSLKTVSKTLKDSKSEKVLLKKESGVVGKSDAKEAAKNEKILNTSTTSQSSNKNVSPFTLADNQK